MAQGIADFEVPTVLQVDAHVDRENTAESAHEVAGCDAGVRAEAVTCNQCDIASVHLTASLQPVSADSQSHNSVAKNLVQKRA